MLEWLSANWVNIVIIAAVNALVVLAIVSMARDKKAGKSSCGCSCSGCALADKCHSVAKAKKP